MGPPPRSFAAMRITASWSGSLAPRIQGCGRSSSTTRGLPSNVAVGWTQDDTLGHDAIADEVPQGDEQLARQGDDHLLARAVLRASFKPPGQGAVLLVVEETPRQLDHAPAHPGIAGSGQPLLAAFTPALMGRAGEAAIAGDGGPVAHVA